MEFLLCIIVGFAHRLLAFGVTPRNGKKSDQAHPPIHPTRFVDNLAGTFYPLIGC